MPAYAVAFWRPMPIVKEVCRVVPSKGEQTVPGISGSFPSWVPIWTATSTHSLLNALNDSQHPEQHSTAARRSFHLTLLQKLLLLHPSIMLPPFPPPDFYQVQLTVLAVFCAVATVVERYISWQKKKASGEANAPKVEERTLLDGSTSSIAGAGKDIFAALRRNYLIVYGIVMGEYRSQLDSRVYSLQPCLRVPTIWSRLGADWLQGPYVYSLYREQYGYSERVVGFLFVTGFTAAGFSGPFVGVWADKL